MADSTRNDGEAQVAAARSRETPSVIVALSRVRRRLDELTESAGEEETARIKDLTAALGG